MATPRVKTPALLLAFEAYLDGKPLSECAAIAGTRPDLLAHTIVTQGWEAMRRDLLASKLTEEKRSVEALAAQQRRATVRHVALADRVICEAEAVLQRLQVQRKGDRKDHVRDLGRLSTVVAEMVRTQRLALNLDTERFTTQTQADSMIAAIREFMEGEDPRPPQVPAAPLPAGDAPPVVH
jgi:hypothetical protein